MEAHEYRCEVCGEPVPIEEPVFWMTGVSREVALTHLQRGYLKGDPWLHVAHPRCRV